MLGATLVAMLASPIHAKIFTKMTAAETATLATIAAIDKNEILLGAIALSKERNSNINDFANMMVAQHGANLTQICEMTQTLAGGMSNQFAEDGNKDLLALGALQGSDFDKKYVDAMVTGHEGALKLINDHLMGTAQSLEIIKFLTDTRAAVVMHLAHAKELQHNFTKHRG